MPEKAPQDPAGNGAEDADASGLEDPPTTIGGILRRLGPGLILAGSIVGSGELIATTRTGAEAGFGFLWLILIGCVIKVFTQVEMTRYAITSSKTTLRAIADVPGGKFINFFWLLMFLAGLAQLGGIVGIVGQALSITCPLTEQGREQNLAIREAKKIEVIKAQLNHEEFTGEERAKAIQELPGLEQRHAEREKARMEAEAAGRVIEPAVDPKIWAAALGVVTILLLTIGGFNFIQTFCTILVGAFTLITVGNLFALQSYGGWAVSWEEFKAGMSFGFPEGIGETKPLSTALATFGIIGVGASELVGYPYWCLEKGYGRSIGPRNESAEWLRRAKGWLRVMKWDAWISMVLYTFSTIAFYLLGAAILHRLEMNPKGMEIVSTLSVMYEPVFGTGATMIFLVGAFAVLFSTFFVSNAQKARLATDALNVFGLARMSEHGRKKSVKVFSVIFPATCVMIFVLWPNTPGELVLFSGLMQALLLPMLGFATLYFRFKRCDQRLKPSVIWDAMLWISFVCFVIIGIYLAFTKGGELINELKGLFG